MIIDLCSGKKRVVGTIIYNFPKQSFLIKHGDNVTKQNNQNNPNNPVGADSSERSTHISYKWRFMYKELCFYAIYTGTLTFMCGM